MNNLGKRVNIKNLHHDTAAQELQTAPMKGSSLTSVPVPILSDAFKPHKIHRFAEQIKWLFTT